MYARLQKAVVCPSVRDVHSTQAML